LGAAWVPCHPEVYFRFAIATGFAAGGGLAGGGIDNFRLGPDLDDKVRRFGLCRLYVFRFCSHTHTCCFFFQEATCGGTFDASLTPLSLTGAPTPWPPRQGKTTASTTTIATTTQTTTTLVIITPPPTPAPTPRDIVTTPAPVTTTPPTSDASTTTAALTPAPTPDETDSLGYETRTFPPIVPETSSETSEPTGPNVTGTLGTSGKKSTDDEGLPVWAIALIIVFALLICCILAALAAWVKNRHDKDDELDRNEDEEFARPPPDSR
jgi:hypothetical protein